MTNWDEREKERQQRIEEERKRYLAMSEVEALQLSKPDQYQRMRYIREIEAAAWLAKERQSLAYVTEKKPVNHSVYRKTKIVYEKD